MNAAEGRPGPPALPATWRPRRGRVVPLVLAAAVLVVSIGLAVFLPPPARPSDRAGFALLGLLVAGGLRQLARCQLAADEQGLTVVNILRTRELEWAELIDVTMVVGDPWPTLDLADGTSLAAMGIQASDGARARLALAQLQALLHERSEGTEPNGT